jgi:hypothetical protein
MIKNSQQTKRITYHTSKVDLIVENTFKTIKSPHKLLALQLCPFVHSIYTHDNIKEMKMVTIDKSIASKGSIECPGTLIEGHCEKAKRKRHPKQKKKKRREAKCICAKYGFQV